MSEVSIEFHYICYLFLFSLYIYAGQACEFDFL